MNKLKEITKGKAKSMFTTENEDHLIMHFSDDTSAFDGKKKEALLGKEQLTINLMPLSWSILRKMVLKAILLR